MTMSTLAVPWLFVTRCCQPQSFEIPNEKSSSTSLTVQQHSVRMQHKQTLQKHPKDIASLWWNLTISLSLSLLSYHGYRKTTNQMFWKPWPRHPRDPTHPWLLWSSSTISQSPTYSSRCSSLPALEGSQLFILTLSKHFWAAYPQSNTNIKTMKPPKVGFRFKPWFSPVFSTVSLLILLTLVPVAPHQGSSSCLATIAPTRHFQWAPPPCAARSSSRERVDLDSPTDKTRGQRWARNNCEWCCGPAWHEWKLDTVMMVNKTANSLCHYWNSKCPLELKPHPPIQELELCTNTVHRECYETHLNLWSYLSNTLWVHLGQENEADYIQVVAHRVYTPGSAAGAAALEYIYVYIPYTFQWSSIIT